MTNELIEEQQFCDLVRILYMSGRYTEREAEAEAHNILDNPTLYPEYISLL